MKITIKKLFACSFLFTVPFLTGTTMIYAQEDVFESDKIPFQMPDNSVVRYLDETHFVVENVEIDAKVRNEILAGIDEIQSFDESTVSYVPGAPEEGVTVHYSKNGELCSIRNKDGSSFDKMKKTDLVINDQISPLADDDHALALIATWGNNNSLYKERGTGLLWGYGNASIFYDEIGNHDNKLKKGDCATKMGVDRCKNGAVVTVAVGSHRYGFIKNDVGSLPNAVVDIWKDGVKYLGGTDYEIKNDAFLKRCTMYHLDS